MLRELAIAPSTFGDWRRRAVAPCARELRDAELLARIREVHADSGGVYGSPRVHAVLRREGETVSRKRVERLMRENGITGVSPARKVCTTIPNPDDPRPVDAVNRQFTAAAPNRLWVTDLTVIATGEGPLWLASIRDAFSRKVIAWETSDTADADLVCAVLEYALRARRPPADGSLVHHADHGSQYTSIKLTTRLVRAGITASMGTVGDSYDNALAENMWSTLKTECVRRREFATRAEANQALFEYLDGFYNPRRIQRNLGYRSPDEFEAAHDAGELTAADLERLAMDAAKRRHRRAKRVKAPMPNGPETAQLPGQRPTPAAKRVRPSGRTLSQRETADQRARSHGKL
ncbi:IS3 family transposase [Actinospica durhamensis]|uniref:IS3 family transposase n=1 Tax=Actinospica durhamensis TaxID=1508375 RepID=UPI0027DD469E|nr:IS3 family transposase [Actinospica durhamensis]